MFMFKTQKGILPRALVVIGMVAIMFSGFILFLLSPEQRPLILGTLELPDFKQRFLLYLSAILLFFFGLYLTSIYPRVLLTRVGLRYLGFILYYGQLRWNEIDELFELKNGTILISINPRRFFLFRGMLFQRLTGVLLGHKNPVLLLAPGLDQRDRVIEEIMANSLVKKVQKIGDPNS
jgi:hypothetical protein